MPQPPGDSTALWPIERTRRVLGRFRLGHGVLAISTLVVLGLSLKFWSDRQEQQLVAGLIVKLKDPDVVRRVDAARELAWLKANAEPAVPALIEGLADDNFNVRWRSAHALGEIGHEASQALPALERASQEENLYVSWAAVEAIAKIKRGGR